MQGIIFLELKKFVELRWGSRAWPALLADGGYPTRIYLPAHEYGDDEMVGLVGTISLTTGVTVPAVLEDFGEFMVPDLLQVYRSLVHATWRTLDLIENTERMIHRVVRLRNPGARPPALGVERKGARALSIRYHSPRRMCAVAKGIARGVAKHYGEAIVLEEPRCMHQGSPDCLIEVRLAD